MAARPPPSWQTPAALQSGVLFSTGRRGLWGLRPGRVPGHLGSTLSLLFLNLGLGLLGGPGLLLLLGLLGGRGARG